MTPREGIYGGKECPFCGTIDDHCHSAECIDTGGKGYGEDMRMSEDNPLYKTALRIRAAGEKGKGCRLSAEECRLLLYHNLPCTAEHPSVGLEGEG